jgi:hypothetical protein
VKIEDIGCVFKIVEKRGKADKGVGESIQRD